MYVFTLLYNFTHFLAFVYRNGELSKKFLKKGEKMVKENKGSVQGRLDRAFFKKGKEFSAVNSEKTAVKKSAVMNDGMNVSVDDYSVEDFENFLNFDEDEMPMRKKSSQKRSSSSSKKNEMKNTRQKIYEEPQDYDTMEPMDTMNLMEVFLLMD